MSEDFRKYIDLTSILFKYLISKKRKTKIMKKINNYNFQQIILSGQPSSLNFLVDNCFKFSKSKLFS